MLYMSGQKPLAADVAIMLGGNLGEPEKFFDSAVAGFSGGGLQITGRSAIYRSAPVDCVPGTPDFSDQALTGRWSGTPEELLALCQKLERAAGRPEKHSSCESRTLDCDIIIFGDKVSNSPLLTLPHPRAKQRRFVLEPLSEIAPDWRFPDSGTTVLQELEALKN